MPQQACRMRRNLWKRQKKKLFTAKGWLALGSNADTDHLRELCAS